MENLDLKQKVIGIIYILAFVTLFTGLFAIVPNLLYYSPTGEFHSFFNTTNWVLLCFVLVLTSVIIYNFFAKRKANLLEIILYVASIVTFIVFIALSYDPVRSNSTYLSVYASHMSIIIQLLAAVVLLLGAKIASLCLSRKQNKETSEVENGRKN